MFYTPDTLTVSEGEKITGRLSCAPNARNNRDLDITIAYRVSDGPEAEIQYKMCVFLSFLFSAFFCVLSWLARFLAGTPCTCALRRPCCDKSLSWSSSRMEL